MPKDGDTEDSKAKFTGDDGLLWESFDREIGRWFQNKHGTQVGDMVWRNEFPALYGEGKLGGADFKGHCNIAWDSINDSNPSKAKHLYPMDSGFYERKWHEKWRKSTMERMYDHAESRSDGSAAIEIQDLGIENAEKARHHLMKQFGGAGEDVRAREERYSDGLPRSKGEPAFYKGIDMEMKLRELGAERTALYKMCHTEKRKEYEFGKETTLVKISMKYLRGTEYQRVVSDLLQEIKIERSVEARLPTLNAKGNLVMPKKIDAEQLAEDWDYRNYDEAWLLSWKDLRSKLVAAYKAKKFQKSSANNDRGGPINEGVGKKLPTMLTAAIKDAVSSMLVPGYGIRPQPPFNGKPGQGPTCWACGKQGHRRGDPQCSAGPNDVYKGAPNRAKKRSAGAGNDGFKSGKGAGQVCRFFQQHGKCKFGEKCKYSHDVGVSVAPPTKKFRLTKAEKRKVTTAAVKFVEKQRKDNKNLGNEDDDAMRDLLKSFCLLRTTPREVVGKTVVDISAMKVSPLLDMGGVYHDTGSAEGLSSQEDDLVYVDTSVDV